MGLAHQNLYTAIKCGVNMLDATILGMGRGAGNVKTLELLRYLNISYGCKYNVPPIKILTFNSFTPLKNKYKWGTNKYYHMSGKYSIHPTYIQEILNSKNYSNKYILKIIDQLKKINARKFDPNNLDTIKNFYFVNFYLIMH
jgi:4-hydroxy 2-oxovalerate aldolase